uniref:Uncharacterized protein n=1 Tax=Cannabis sativa TaxID=3483 RepID=A0A803R2B3_CANSA
MERTCIVLQETGTIRMSTVRQRGARIGLMKEQLIGGMVAMMITEAVARAPRSRRKHQVIRRVREKMKIWECMKRLRS